MKSSNKWIKFSEEEKSKWEKWELNLKAECDVYSNSVTFSHQIYVEHFDDKCFYIFVCTHCLMSSY